MHVLNQGTQVPCRKFYCRLRLASMNENEQEVVTFGITCQSSCERHVIFVSGMSVLTFELTSSTVREFYVRQPDFRRLGIVCVCMLPLQTARY